MADRLIHNRVFKVSKELNRLDLLCEQHRRQVRHREGLPDWERPTTPAGKASGRHGRTPAFFAWNEEPESVEQRTQSTWQTETPQKVARTLDMSNREGDEDREPAPERSPYHDLSEDAQETATVLPLPTGHDEGMDEDSAIEVDSDDRSAEEDQPVVTGRSIAVSPIREDILDRVHPSAVTTVPTRYPPPPPPVDVASSPYRPSSSPRYRHGRRLHASDAAIPSPHTQRCAAGVTTEQADRNRMSRSSGKRFRSPAKPTSLWGDLCNSYIHQSGASNSNSNSRDIPNFSHKRIVRSAAERTFGGSSVFRTLNMDTYGWAGSESTRGERHPVLTGSEAMNVANQAVREFLGGHDEESKHSEQSLQLTDETSRAATAESRTINNRKNKRVSFGGDCTRPQPRTLPVLADKTTQTEDSLLPARNQTRTIRREAQSRDSGSPVRCVACDTAVDESGRPRKVPRNSTNSVGSAPTPQRNFHRTSSHLTNPIMINPRYPPEPTTFRGRSTYSSVFNDRLPWR